MTERIAFLGLGVMGRAICANIATKYSHQPPLLIWNRTSSRTADFKSQQPDDKCAIASSVEAAVNASDIIISCVKDDTAILDIFKALDHDILKGKLWIDCTTVQPSTSVLLTDRCSADGGSFIACPVYGAAPVAAAGNLVITPAGPAQDLDRLATLSPAFSRLSLPLRDAAPAQASQLKALSNTLVLAQLHAVAAAHVMAAGLRVDGEVLHQLIEANFPGAWGFFSGRMLSGEYARDEEPLSSAQTSCESLTATLERVKSCGVPSHGLELGIRYLKRAGEVMGRNADVVALYGSMREEAGLSFAPG